MILIYACNNSQFTLEDKKLAKRKKENYCKTIAREKANLIPNTIFPNGKKRMGLRRNLPLNSTVLASYKEIFKVQS